jgi:hypothetical protein
VHGVGDLNKCWRLGLVGHARESRSDRKRGEAGRSGSRPGM